MFRRAVDWVENLKNSPGKVLISLAALIMVGNLAVTYKWNFYKYSKRELALQLLAESHGLVLDIVILGALLVWINSVNERKKSIDTAKGEIDDLRMLKGDSVMVRMMRNIRTLQQYGITALDLHTINVSNGTFRLYNLKNSNMVKLTATQSHFQGSDLSGCNMMSAAMNRCDFSNADLSKIKAYATDFSRSYLVNSNADNGSFINANFTGAKINKTSFVGSDFTGADFTDAAFYKSDLRNCAGLTIEQLSKCKYIIECIFSPQQEELLREHGLLKSKVLA